MAQTAPTRVERAWDVLRTVLDPEVPAVSVVDLGIVLQGPDNAAGSAKFQCSRLA